MPLESIAAARSSIAASRGHERQVRRKFHESQVPMTMLDSERRILDANRSARLLLHLSLAQLRGRRAEDLVSPLGVADIQRAWAELSREGQTTGRQKARLPDGSEIDLVYHALANVLPGEHLVIAMPAAWPDDELGADEVIAPDADADADTTLSPRERQVLALTASGAGLSQIAEELTISPSTAKTHLRNVHRKLGARNRAQAIAIAIDRGLVDLPGRRYSRLG